jgi:hypothetical protein
VAKEQRIYYNYEERNGGFVVNGALIDFFHPGYKKHFYNCISCSWKKDM